MRAAVADEDSPGEPRTGAEAHGRPTSDTEGASEHPPAHSPSGPLSIGEVLSVLTEEFPDITISKIRFLESQGLVKPERNASGYRQFGDSDIERLRWILRQQRDHYLPLKVIRRALERGVDVIDAGAGDQPTLWTAVADAAAREEVASQKAATARDEAAQARRSAARSGAHPARRSEAAPSSPETAAQHRTRARYESPADVVAALQEDPRRTPRATEEDSPAPGEPDARPGAVEGHGGAAEEPSAESTVPADDREARTPLPHGGDMRELSRSEFLAETELREALLDELVEFGLVEPTTVAGEELYDDLDIAIGTAASRAAELGISPRHLRIYKVAAVREAGLLEQLAMPMLKQRNPDSRARAAETVSELASLGAELHSLLLGRELGPNLRP
ncbi:MAG: MerR family DNA-binding transcriptional regulator [Microthrixaceae bacterium]